MNEVVRVVQKVIVSNYAKIRYGSRKVIVFRMAQSEPSSGVKGKAIYNKNLSN